MKTINVFKNEQRENLFASGQGTGKVVTDVKSINGDIIIDIAGANGTVKIGGFGGSRRVVDAYCVVSAIGNADNTLVFHNLSAASNSLSMFSIAVSAALKQRPIRNIKRSNCIIAANSLISFTGAGTTPANIRATVIIKTIPV